VFGDLPLDSDDKFAPDSPYNPSSPYSSSKASSDLLVRAWVRSFDLKATISNCSNNFGPYQHEEKLIPRVVKLIASERKPEVYGNGLNVRDWIHVDDHTDGVWAIIDRGQLGTSYLLGAYNERSNLEVVKNILELMGKPKDWIEFVDDRPGHDRKYAMDLSETERSLGWKPRLHSFEDQLQATVEFYLNSHKNAGEPRKSPPRPAP
jgi:dTDP-glucose 4,6-dehydratase